MGLAVVSPAPSGPTRIITRTAWAILCATILVSVATAANFLTTASKPISILFEPFSLLLLPGLLFSLLSAGPHDYSPYSVVIASLIVYSAFFYFILGWLSRRRKR